MEKEGYYSNGNVEKSQLAVTKCHSYDIEEVQTAVDVSMNALGGLDSYIGPGDRVLLKPNLLKARFPEELVNTHPSILEAVINLVRDVKGVPLVGDSPGSSVERGYGTLLEDNWP